MRVLLAGATGAIGRPLTAQLLAAGHEVCALTRSEASAEDLRNQGATPLVCDVFDRAKLRWNVWEARPEVVVNQLTALPRRIDPRKIRRQLAATDRLRTEGTRNLFAAAKAAGAGRFVSQSVAFAYQPDGTGLKTEDSPLHARPSAAYRGTFEAVRSTEAITLGDRELPGVVLRYGFFYGPGTFYAPDGSFAEDVRGGKVPLVGQGTGVFSFIHVEDAAAATLAALERGEPGIYNIVDDEPAALAEWLPRYVEWLGAPPPKRVSRWLARLLAGPYAVYMMCDQQGASNARAKQRLGWTPRFASWRSGFPAMLQAEGANGKPEIPKRPVTPALRPELHGTST